MTEELKLIISAEMDKLKKELDKANNDVKKFSGQTQTESGKVKQAMEKIGKAAQNAGKAIGKAMVNGSKIAVTAIAGLSAAAVKQYADYEQLVGGVETLFKDSADVVKEYSKQAYEAAGMSANEYMETVTGFSASLLQSLGGDTAKAAEYANQAVIDMSDNANKMGTSMESIQNAYSGFAKGNFTMLDNLKLGYGGTKEEMERLVADAAKLDESIDANSLSFGNVTKAIHAVQKEMGITGTTAEEARKTISGSLSMVKASFSNLLVGVADDNADFQGLIDDFVESVGVAFDNLLPRIETSVLGVASLAESLLPKIVENIPVLVDGLLPPLLEALEEITMYIVGEIPNLLDTITKTIETIIPTIAYILIEVGEALAENFPAFVENVVAIIVNLAQVITDNIPTVLDAFVSVLPVIIQAVVDAVPELLEAGVEFFTALVDAIPEFLPDLIEELPDIIDAVLDMIFDNLDVILDAGLQLFNSIVEAIPEFIPILVEKLPEIINNIVDTLIENIPVIIEAGVELFMGLVKAIPKIIPALIEGLAEIVSNVGSHLIEKLKDIMNFDWKLPKLKLPHVNVEGSFSLAPPRIPKFSIDWYAQGGVFDKPTLFPYGNNSIGGLGEAGAEAVVPLEKNTVWLDKIAERLNKGDKVVQLVVDKRVLGEVTVDGINGITAQTGTIPLRFA